MNYKCLIVCVFIYISIVSFETQALFDEPEYYWADYEFLPDNAVEGGVDFQGRSTYIGQVIHSSSDEEAVIPGEVYPREESIYYMYKDKSYKETNFKILCSNYSTRFQWMNINNKEMRFFLPYTHFLIGGHTRAYPLFIGRAKNGGKQTFVGRITFDDQHERLDGVNDGKIFYTSKYEALVYDECLN